MCTDSKGSMKFSGKSAGLLLIRIAVAAVFIYHGWSKFAAMDNTIIFFSSIGLAPFFAYLVAGIELLGGVLMLLGAYTCVAGLALAVIMIFSIFLVKIKMGFVPAEPDILLFASTLAVALIGPGRYSLQKCCSCGWCKKMHKSCCSDCKDCKDCKDCGDASMSCVGGVCVKKDESASSEKSM